MGVVVVMGVFVGIVVVVVVGVVVIVVIVVVGVGIGSGGGGGGGGRSNGDGCDVSRMINKHMLHKQTTGILLHSIPVNSAEHSGLNSRMPKFCQNDENSRPSCQSSFLWSPLHSAGMTRFLQELGGHCKVLATSGKAIYCMADMSLTNPSTVYIQRKPLSLNF